MSAHKESIRAGLQGVTVSRSETHEATKCRHTIVVPIVKTDENVRRVLDARNKERGVDIGKRIRITMCLRLLKPDRIGSKAVAVYSA